MAGGPFLQVITPAPASFDEGSVGGEQLKRKSKTMSKYTKEQIELERILSAAANDEGTIQAADMLEIAPHHRPELHTTMSVSRAFEAITGEEYDADFFCD